MKNIVRLASVLTLLPVAAGIAGAQTANTTAEAAAASSALSPVDYNFVAQANLGAPFQIDSGRIAEKRATSSLSDLVGREQFVEDGRPIGRVESGN
jgi:putative membrane protein